MSDPRLTEQAAAAAAAGAAAPAAAPAAAAIAAAQAAGTTVTMLRDAAGAHRAADLFAEIWAVTTAGIPISAHLIRALAHAGNYVAGAWVGDELVGASVAFLELDGGRLSLHSHITGVAPQVRRARLGFALKQHQRAWALERGIDEISWTFDPLIGANARFNLVKLGAVAVAYHPDFYGEMEDGINAGDRSDRCTVRWDLTAPGVVAAGEGRWPDIGEAQVPSDERAVLLAVDRDGNPVVHLDNGRRSPRPGPLFCCVPADVVAMRATDPARARAWRQALRDTMGAAMAGGFVARTVTRDGCYVLTRPEDKDEEPVG